MQVLNFKYVACSFSFSHFPIGSDYMIPMLTNVNVCREKMCVYCLIFFVLFELMLDISGQLDR